MKPGVLQIAPMMQHVEAALNNAYTVYRYWDAANKDALISANADNIRAVATSGHHGCPKEVMAGLPNLEIIASYGVGYDAIDVAACKAAGVRVSNTPDVLNDAVAEITLGLMIALCRRIPQADQHTRNGQWLSGNYPLTGELTGAKVGILGLGRIGKEIARLGSEHLLFL